MDFAFYVSKLNERELKGTKAMVRFDRFGVGVEEGRPYGFDAERNWYLVEAILEDPQADVQWIFVSNGLKALRFA